LWRYFPIDTASDTLTLYAVTSLNFFAFIIFAFIFLRSIIKLRRERRSLAVGSKLKTRLLVYFVAVSLLPIAAMAVFSYLFLNRALEKWFSRLPETVIAEARDVQRRTIAERFAAFDDKAQLFAAFVESQIELNEQTLRSALVRGNLAAAEIVAANGTILARVEREFPTERHHELRDDLRRAGQTEARDLQDGLKFDATALMISDGRVLRVVSAWQDEAGLSRGITNSPEEFERLKQQQTEVRQLGFSTLSLLTFLLIFAASWIAFHLGRNLTQPIRALAEASGEIARGNLAYRIDVPAEDELALLVTAFNQMAGELQGNQAKLNERRNYIETVLQSLSTGVVSLDENNQITTINAAAIEMLLLDSEATENGFLAEIVSADDRLILEKLLVRARRIGNASEQTVLLRHNENGSANESLPVALTATALRETSGKTVGAVLVIEDLSELLSAQRAAAWQEVARRMAHEIKNPLTPIQLAAERIAKNFARESGNHDLNGKGQFAKVLNQSTETILQEVSSLKVMVDEFSQFARLPHAKLESNDLNQILLQSIALYEDRLEGAKIETDFAADLPPAMLDAEQIRRVFINLIENALESFDQNGANQISIKTSHDVGRDLLVAEIADTGKGIAKNDFAKLFQPYFSTKGRGTGLGLAIVQRIITEHGGRIRATANQPKGAKFIIELPVALM
jgi:PAS domain S-box-containing protein